MLLMRIARPAAGLLPRADEHTVLVLPGFMSDDWSTVTLRKQLDRLGYRTVPWGLGTNVGARDELVSSLIAFFENLVAASDGKISIIGHSLGGVYARELARMRPDSVRQVITLGSPIRDRGRSSNVWRAYEVFSGHKTSDPLFGGPLKRRRPPGVPSTAIYTKTDGVVSWRVCLEMPHATTQNIEVPGSHCGLVSNPVVFAVIAGMLAQPEDHWQPFKWSQVLRTRIGYRI